MSGTLFDPQGASGGADDRILVTRLSIAVFDRGPEPAWHRDRNLFGPWQRYEAALEDHAPTRALGHTPWEAMYVLVANHRPVLQRVCAGGPAA